MCRCVDAFPGPAGAAVGAVERRSIRWLGMASRLLRTDLYRACRPVRPTGNQSSGSNALFYTASTSDHPKAGVPSGTQSSTAAAGIVSSQGWHCLSNQAYSSAREFSSTISGGGVGAQRSPIAARRVGAPFPSATPGREPCCLWRGAGGLVLCGRWQQQAGRRYLSTRRGKATGQALKNEQIKAQQVLLVLETAGGGKETTLVSRQQALAAADAASLDLVQVSGDKDPVVCRLMDFKREEYRKHKQKKASAKRVQKKKEVRLRGMIAGHDFERKVSDVRKYLNRGDMVKVVLEANTSLLKRSGNCLDDLQERFEAEMEEFEGVVMKAAGGGDGYTRREIDCIPRAGKATPPKPSRSSDGPQAAPGGAAAGGAGQAGSKEKSKPLPLASKVIDEEVLREILNGDDGSSGSADDLEAVKEKQDSSDESSSEESSDESSSEESCSSSDEEMGGVEAGVEEGEQDQKGRGKDTPLEVGGAVIWDVELSGELAEAVDDNDDTEWERNEARKREDRRKREEAKARVREADKFAKRGGPRGARKKWRVAEDDPDGGFGGAEWSEDLGGSRRSSAGTPGGRGRGKGDGGGRGAGAGAGAHGRGQAQGGFARRGVEGRPGGVPRNGPPRGGGGFGPPDGGGRGGGGRGREMPAPAAPVRTTPYKWRTSIAGGNGPTGAAEVVAVRPSWSRGSGGGDAGAEDAGGDIRGFRARFGGKASGSDQQEAPSTLGSMGIARSDSPAAGAAAASSDRNLIPPKVTSSPPAAVKPTTWSHIPKEGGDRGDGTEE